ncbi:hypothetical protein [Streptomyces coeruleorubidus]|uniref:hypothetical protein n=1 Tax=Streptomyces coeruleorubidus TaxID=116188 RepID=UPI0036596325
MRRPARRREEQRVSLRLARQRPDRVRARERAEQPEPAQPEESPPWLRRVPWAHIGTVVGAAAAIGGLVFTGVATFYGAEVSKDQLNQSRDDTERESRDQAMRITYWEEASWDEGGSIHVINRSPDPVSRIGVAVSAMPLNARVKHLYYLPLKNVPPCSELVFPEEEITPLSGKATHVRLSRMEWDVQYLRFTDRDGKHWQRTPVGLSERHRPFAGWPEDGFLYHAKAPKEKAVTPCSDHRA